MTETVSGAAAQGGSSKPAKGLTLRRIYTREGIHPYDDVTWERRDVVMTNWRDGSVNFEQHGVEFPDFWSVNAANIVTTKYFRGALGTQQREWSLKQLVDRVVGTYAAAGREHGYFATEQDAEIFEHELKYALIHQIFSFNSPVWFNVGTTSPQQVSACQPYDSLVSTPAGPIAIGSLVESDAVGMKVYDAHGTTRIVATKANGVKEVLRLHTTAGHVLEATADHLVWRATDLDVGEFTVAGFLRPGDHLLYVQPDMGGSDRALLDISKVENLGPMEVYDIQTESGEYLSGNLRVHNCFILAVDDTMDSILEWYREEGLIFKGGSGAGVNLSRIRSSKELLSSGGTASGPVSFMRGADASAGTIKSGGATRRAAKMVVLDVDHPDVEEFIETKAREEEKIRVLRDGGFDMDLGGKDIASVQYQNANNSVRVSDEFMRAVEGGRTFDLAARTTGEPVAQVDAKTLFGKMAKAAWECADPGIQYDGTINDWHTCPESGRITASNPCSEYVHLDNSSCNLASINLLKFLRERRHLRGGEVRAAHRADHHRDGHLDLLRGLPDGEDHRDDPRLPAAGHRVRQPRRPADGHRARLRFRRRPRHRRRDHLTDDRHGVQALGRACRGSRTVRGLRAQRCPRTSASSPSTRQRARPSARSAASTRRSWPPRTRPGRSAWRWARRTATGTRRRACSRQRARSA